MATTHPSVLRLPATEVLLMGYGDSSIDFQLRVWIENAWQVPRIRSDLLFEGWDALKLAGVEIPFPQRDLHIKSGTLGIIVERNRSDLRDDTAT